MNIHHHSGADAIFGYELDVAVTKEKLQILGSQIGTVPPENRLVVFKSDGGHDLRLGVPQVIEMCGLGDVVLEPTELDARRDIRID
jgi:hypothetical protein